MIILSSVAEKPLFILYMFPVCVCFFYSYYRAGQKVILSLLPFLLLKREKHSFSCVSCKSLEYYILYSPASELRWFPSAVLFHKYHYWESISSFAFIKTKYHFNFIRNALPYTLIISHFWFSKLNDLKTDSYIFISILNTLLMTFLILFFYYTYSFRSCVFDVSKTRQSRTSKG